MKLRGDITINDKLYRKGESVPMKFVYPFFLFHMGMFGLSGFFMAYGADDVELMFLYLHGGIAILAYVAFYLVFFGLDEVKWMFINAGLGLLGIYTQVDWLLSLFGKDLRAYPLHINVVPFLYYVLYTFLLRQALLDLAGARGDEERRRAVDNVYVGGSVTLSLAAFFL